MVLEEGTSTTSVGDVFPYGYFTDFSVEATDARYGRNAALSIHEMDAFSIMTDLIGGMNSTSRNKDNLTIISGDLATSLFYLAAKSEYRPCSDHAVGIDQNCTSKKQQLDTFIKCMKCFIHNLQLYKSKKIRRQTCKMDLSVWSDRIVWLLLKVADVKDLHTLFLTRIQRESGIHTIQCDRLAFVRECSELEDQIRTLRLFPATYDLSKTTWVQLKFLFSEAGLDMQSNIVTIDYLANKIRELAMQKDKDPHINVKQWLAQKLFCSPEIINLDDIRTLWHPISRWLHLDNFVTICSEKYPGTRPWFICNEETF
jgi:hypothetical protein